MSKRMILADDTPFVREDYAKEISLLVKDVEIEQVADGESLLDRVRSGGYSLVLTDNRMPKMHGLEAIKQIREFDQQTPIYLLSSEDVGKYALEAGATGFILKENVYRQLPAIVKQYLE